MTTETGGTTTETNTPAVVEVEKRPGGEATEASLLPRAVAILTPLFTIAAGWIANWVAQHTGAQLDQTQIVTFMAVASVSALTAAWKWLQGWQQHEALVAQGLDAPRKPGPDAPVPPASR